jgi:hypothetical protein
LGIGYSQGSSPETIEIKGEIVDKSNKQPVIGAYVFLKDYTDSTLIKTTTDIIGRFSFKVKKGNSYQLQISALGFAGVIEKLDGSKPLKALYTYSLEDISITTKTINFTGQALAVKQKKDTLEYNADAFFTNPEADAEKLIKKLPGIVIDKEGNIKAQGEEVARITVDGQSFFGDDKNAVLKNLPVKTIDKIQVVDAKKEGAEGDTKADKEKLINIVTKASYKTLTFGKVYGGYGTQDRYDGGLSYNVFQGKRRLTILGRSNNINEQSFSWSDFDNDGQSSQDVFENYMNFYSGEDNGISKTNLGGINYNDSLGKKTSFALSLNINQKETKTIEESQRYYLINSGLGSRFDDYSDNFSANNTNKLTIKTKSKLDSLTTLNFNSNINFNKSKSNNFYQSKTFLDSAFNQSDNTNRFNSQSFSINNSAHYRRRGKKKGRSYSANASFNYNNRKNDNNSILINEYSSDTQNNNARRQLTNHTAVAPTFSVSGGYQEPIDSVQKLRFNQSFSYNNNESDKINTSSPYFVTNEIYTLDSNLSNHFNNISYSPSSKLTYELKLKKIELEMSGSYQYQSISNQQTFPEEVKLEKSFNNFIPEAELKYLINDSTYFISGYDRRTRIGNIKQFQNVIDNSNPLRLRIGNPSLKQTLTDKVYVGFTRNRNSKNSYFSTKIEFRQQKNQISEETIFAQKDTIVYEGMVLNQGNQLLRPVNINGNYEVSGEISYYQSFKFLESNFNISLEPSLTKNPTLINNVLNYTTNKRLNLYTGCHSNYKEMISGGVFGGGSVNEVINSGVSGNNFTNYFDYNIGAYLEYNYKEKFDIEFSEQYNGYQEFNKGNIKRQFFRLDGQVSQKFLKNDKGTIKLTAYDILKTYKNLNRNVESTYYEDSRTNVLTQYFMLSFLYKI